MVKRFWLWLWMMPILLWSKEPIETKEHPVVVHLFWVNGCSHCAKEKAFLNTLKNKYPSLKIQDYEITLSSSLLLLEKVQKELSIQVTGVPFTVIGRDYFSGYHTDKTTGEQIEKAIQRVLANGSEDFLSFLDGKSLMPPLKIEQTIETLTIPLFGDVNIKKFSLPLLTLVIAILDGFNPCAMWTLLFLISLLLGMENKKRMWILGLAFLISSGLIYFLVLAAWLNFFLFLGFVMWIRITIGLVALAASGYYLYDFFVNKSGACSVTGSKKRQRIFEKLKAITQKKQFFLAIGGIILLGFSVNLVELFCSLGLPAVYTQILSLANLTPWQYYLYLLFYIIIFMLDDIVVFFVAMLTLRMIGIDGKYSRYSHLLGGVLMLIIGILILCKPEWLMLESAT